jgi:hypothetical protein
LPADDRSSIGWRALAPNERRYYPLFEFTAISQLYVSDMPHISAENTYPPQPEHLGLQSQVIDNYGVIPEEVVQFENSFAVWHTFHSHSYKSGEDHPPRLKGNHAPGQVSGLRCALAASAIYSIYVMPAKRIMAASSGSKLE